MSDQRLRELIRLSATNPAIEHRLLRERVRVGHLSRARLELAAYVGHRPALAALGQEWTQPWSVSDWVAGLSRWGKTPCARALLVLAGLALPSYRWDQRERLEPGIAAIRDWVRCPCTVHARRAADSGGRPRRARDYPRAARAYVSPQWWSDRAPALGTLLVARTRKEVARLAGEAAILLLYVSDAESEQVTGAVRDDLAPWALGQEAPASAEGLVSSYPSG